MRVVLSAYDSRGGVEPLIGLAVRLRGLGAEVTVCAPPDEVPLRGVPFVPVGMSPRELMRGPVTGTIRDRAGALIADQFAKLPAVLEGADVLVACGILPSVAGARSVAEMLNIPYVYAAFQPNSLPSPHHRPIARPGHPLDPAVTDNRVLWEQDATAANELFRDVLNAERARHGLPEVKDVRDHGFTDLPWLATDSLLGPWLEPADLEVVQTGTWILPDEGDLPDEVEAFLDQEPLPVYVGFGSMPVAEELARAAVDAARAQGHPVILSAGWAGLDAEDCLVVGEISHPALFKRVAAVVHHGGSGTTHTAARAGVPQVIVPHGGDQPYWAERVTALGIGATGESVADALKVAMAPETAAHAAAVAAAMYPDGAAVAAEMLIEEFRP
ncbi:glycosyl transferase [Actinoplanes cyaneus]|uniref:Glycosyl transferase n=1 Tax=Actinoplanes cyaneus TaxID=52696 RepID=A0A919IPX7_9ACTN|nr:glycosyltransferase [Actinoplanes cyaneus]MCW2142944.1 vancomycin aglycone glucosyltransferase [Actinoplanes cyaneus]GID69624.1 glycosyl transferase [Actinoplanes cyaneus]